MSFTHIAIRFPRGARNAHRLWSQGVPFSADKVRGLVKPTDAVQQKRIHITKAQKRQIKEKILARGGFEIAFTWYRTRGLKTIIFACLSESQQACARCFFRFARRILVKPLFCDPLVKVKIPFSEEIFFCQVAFNENFPCCRMSTLFMMIRDYGSRRVVMRSCKRSSSTGGRMTNTLKMCSLSLQVELSLRAL